jgi:hypothetical protein
MYNNKLYIIIKNIKIIIIIKCIIILECLRISIFCILIFAFFKKKKNEKKCLQFFHFQFLKNK